jgi:hypothetical protein
LLPRACRRFEGLKMEAANGNKKEEVSYTHVFLTHI